MIPVNPLSIAFTLILGLIYCFFGMRLVLPLNIPEPFSVLAWIVLFIPFLLLWLVPMVYWQRDEYGDTKREILFQWTSFLSAGLVSFVLFYGGIREVFQIFNVFDERSSAIAVWVLAFVSLFWGMKNALTVPGIKEVVVPISGLPKEFEGFRIAQISDLHIGPIIQEKYVREVARRISGTNPHFVAMTGDIADGSVEAFKRHLKPLGDIQSVYGSYYVTGNHEYYWSGDSWIKALEGVGVRALLNSSVLHRHDGQEFLVSGVVDDAAAIEKKGVEPDLELTLRDFKDRILPLRILLAHQPKIAQEAAQFGFHLQLSGHTHGGQFIPWTWVAGFFHKFYVGLGRCEQMWVYVSRGTGTWGPPVRLGSPTEITLLRLTSS